MGLRAPLKQVGPPWRNPMTGKFCDEIDFDTAVSDVEHIRKTIHELRHPPLQRYGTPCGERTEECQYPSCDCFDSEIVMLSTGYADVGIDGEVVSGGKVIYSEDY